MREREVIQFQSEEIDFKGIVMKYLRFWYLFLLGIIVCTGIAFLYLRYTTPQYSINSTLLIKDDQKGADIPGNAVFSDLDIFKSSKNISNEIQVLKSKSLMLQVLKELNLYTSYFVEGDVKTSEIYGRSLPLKVIVHAIDSAAFDKTLSFLLKGNNRFEFIEGEKEAGIVYRFGEEIQNSIGRFTVIGASLVDSSRTGEKIKVKFHNIQKLANYYNQQLNVVPINKEASVLSISLIDPVPEKGVDIINKLVEVYNKEAVEDKNQIAANTIEFIDDRLKFLTQELSGVEKDVEQYKRRFELTDVSSEARLYMERASEYNRQLAEHEIQLDVLSSIENYLKKEENQFELVPSSLSIQDPTLQGLIMKFNELQLDRQRMLRTTKPNNPLVQNMDDQLANLRVNILENLRNIQKGMLVTKQNLQKSSAQFEARIEKVPSIERELLEINRQQGIKEGLYLYLLQKREESALSLAATVSNSRVIDAAMASDSPVKPQKKMIYLLALLVGVGLPFAGLYLQDLLNDRVQELKDVEKATETPVLGEVSHKRTDDILVVTQESKSPVAELFRLIRTNLQFATAGKVNKVILVTSSMSGEGKTFFSLNLAASLVLSGKRAVVLDFDFRKPGLTRNLGYQHDLGITNYLISESVAVEELIKNSPVLSNLFLIGSGPVPPNPAELMLLPKIEELINGLKERFDYIIIDTSPVGQVADALSLAPYVDSSLYLIRYNYTHKEQVKIVDDIYKNKKLKYPMIVLNDARKENTYGYGYGYGEQEKLSFVGRLKRVIGNKK